MRFTATSVRTAAAGDGSAVDLVDERYPGLVLRVTPSGTRSWRLLATRPDGRHTWTTIAYATTPPRQSAGVPVLGLAEVLEVYHAARTGRRDSAAARLEAKIAALERELEAARCSAGYGLSFRELVDQFLERYSARRHSPRYRREVLRMLEVDALPVWGERPAAAIRQVDVAAVLHAVADRGAPIQANRLLRALSRLYGWGTSVGLVPHSPVADLEPLGQERRREHVLDDDELVAVRAALEARSYPDPTAPARLLEISDVLADALLMALFTLQRRQEVCAMRWQAVRERPWWTLASAETKARRQHRVFLTSPAIEVLERQSASRFRGDYVFAGRRGAAHVHPDAVSHAFAELREGLRAAGTVRRRYTVHDLRRTGRTALSRLGVAPHVGDKVLNHGTSGVRAHYDLYAWDREVQQALELWTGHLQALQRARGRETRR